MRLVFMGTPAFSVPPLEALHAAGHEIAAVYTQPPRRAGRGQSPRPGPVAERAAEIGLEVRWPETLKGDAAAAEVAGLGAELAVVVAYGLILPRGVLDAPSRGCWNIHASLLPRWRGAAPIHRAVMAGDADTGVCVMAMEPGLDTGPVLTRHATPIGSDETTGDLHDRLSALGAEAIVDAVARADALAPTPQPDEGVTYAAKVDKAEARIDWSEPAEAVARRINGLSPFPGAWCKADEERLKLLRARPAEGDGAAGTVLPGFVVACGDGAVEVLEVQRPGRSPQSAADALRGMPLPDRLT